MRASSAVDIRKNPAAAAAIAAAATATKTESSPTTGSEPLTSSAQRIIQKLREESRAQVEEVSAVWSPGSQLYPCRPSPLSLFFQLQGQIRSLKTKISEKEKQFHELEAELRTAAGLLQERTATLERREKRLESQTKQIQEIHGSKTTLSLPVPLVAPNDFFLIKQVAMGSSGSEIYKASWRGHIVAFKKVVPRYKTMTNVVASKRSNEEWHPVHLSELNLLCKLRHKNIVSLVGASTDARHMILVLDFHKSRDLRTVLNSKAEITPAQRASWALSAARALAYLHSSRPKPILHMDIDSSNLLVEGASLKLADFSNCAIAANIELDNHTLLPRGNPAYMAPEHFRQEPLSPKTEVFALGVLLWEIWTRRVPWKGVGSASIEAAILIGDRLEIPNGEVPGAIARLIKRCWVDEASERPDTIEVVTELWNYKRLGVGKSPATPYPLTGQSSATSSVVLSPRTRTTAGIEVLKSPVAVPGTPPPGPSSSGSTAAAGTAVPLPAVPLPAVPLPLLPSGTSPLSAIPRAASPTPQRFTPSLQKYKLQLLDQMKQDQPGTASPRAQSPPTADDPTTKQLQPQQSSAPQTIPSPTSLAQTELSAPPSPNTNSTHTSASATPEKVDSAPSSPKQLLSASGTVPVADTAAEEADPVDAVLGILDAIAPHLKSFEPPPASPTDTARRNSTMDEILKRAESLLDGD